MKTPAEESAEVGKAGLSRTSALSRSQEFEWFLQECVDKEMAALDGVLHDVSKTPEDRTKALERWHALKKVREWVPEQLPVFQRMVGQAN